MRNLAVIIAGALFCVSAHGESLIMVNGRTVRTSGNNIVVNNGTVIVDGVTVTGPNDNGVTKGSGKIITQTRDIPMFQELVVDIPANVRVSAGDQSRYSIKVDDNLLPLISFNVKDGGLRVSSEKGFSTKNRIEINLQVPGLTRVVLKGAGHIDLDGVAKEKISFEVSGSGDISGSGKTKDIIASLDGSGSLLLQELKAANVRVVVNGSGNARVSATDTLSGEINGSGDIAYSGSPRTVNTVVHGSGDITKE
jgi:hypothetical protein